VSWAVTHEGESDTEALVRAPWAVADDQALGSRLSSALISRMVAGAVSTFE
jgi:hypothetical protein